MNLMDDLGADRFRSFNPKRMSRMAAPKSSVRMDRAMEERAVYNQRNLVVAKQDFEEVESTSEYRETHYFNKTQDDSFGLVRLNRYWCDYARHLISGQGPFLSQTFIDCSEDERASFFVLCTLDLPMSVPGPHTFRPDD